MNYLKEIKEAGKNAEQKTGRGNFYDYTSKNTNKSFFLEASDFPIVYKFRNELEARGYEINYPTARDYKWSANKHDKETGTTISVSYTEGDIFVHVQTVEDRREVTATNHVNT